VGSGWVETSAELSRAAVGACDEPTDAVGNSGRTTDFILGDMLTVWKLDRFVCSLRDLIAMLEDFEKRGIHFRSLTEEINTATPGGKLIFHILGVLAEFERGLIIERTRQG
jgi:DNA invertase Pin-like site-specific DNA recombinase